MEILFKVISITSETIAHDNAFNTDSQKRRFVPRPLRPPRLGGRTLGIRAVPFEHQILEEIWRTAEKNEEWRYQGMAVTPERTDVSFLCAGGDRRQHLTQRIVPAPGHGGVLRPPGVDLTELGDSIRRDPRWHHPAHAGDARWRPADLPDRTRLEPTQSTHANGLCAAWQLKLSVVQHLDRREVTDACVRT